LQGSLVDALTAEHRPADAGEGGHGTVVSLKIRREASDGPASMCGFPGGFAARPPGQHQLGILQRAVVPTAWSNSPSIAWFHAMSARTLL
jgi:hypothetical protein